MEKNRENKKGLLGHRLRAIRKDKGWTQEELGARADTSYKFIGEIERGQQNPSFDILAKIADALDVELFELFRFEQEATKRKDIESQMVKILRGISEEDLRKIFFVVRGIYPHI